MHRQWGAAAFCLSRYQINHSIAPNMNLSVQMQRTPPSLHDKWKEIDWFLQDVYRFSFRAQGCFISQCRLSCYGSKKNQTTLIGRMFVYVSLSTLSDGAPDTDLWHERTFIRSPRSCRAREFEFSRLQIGPKKDEEDFFAAGTVFLRRFILLRRV